MKQRIKTRLSVKETIDMSNAGREDERFQDMARTLSVYAKRWMDKPVYDKQLKELVEEINSEIPEYDIQTIYDKMITAYEQYVNMQNKFHLTLTKIDNEING